jgi:putative flippase GtrA
VESCLTALMGHEGARENAEFVRFLIAGGLNTSFCFLIYCLAILAGLNYAAANTISWMIGVVVGFLLSSRFVFRKAYGHARFFVFICSNILSLIVSIASLTLFIKVIGMDAIMASVASIPLVVAVSYLTAKFGVFR